MVIMAKNDFIFAKVARSQCNKCLGGCKGLNRIRKSFLTMKKVKPNQSRSENTEGLSTAYTLFGHRKEQHGKQNGECDFTTNC